MSTLKDVKRVPVVHPRHSRRRVTMDPVGETMTKQEFRDDCDINVIVDKYILTGVMPQYNLGKQPQFGDFAEVGDYQQAMNRVMDAQNKFNMLPAEIRDHFQNDPAQLIAAVSDPSRYQELVDIGLVEPAPGGALGSDARQAAQAGSQDTSTT